MFQQSNQAPSPSPHTLQPIRKILSTIEMRARREKEPCYNCDEIFIPGHKCKQSHIFFLMTAEEEAAYENQNPSDSEVLMQQGSEVDISCNAMADSSGVNTINVYGTKGRHKLTILVDTGCTHYFISEP